LKLLRYSLSEHSQQGPLLHLL